MFVKRLMFSTRITTRNAATVSNFHPKISPLQSPTNKLKFISICWSFLRGVGCYYDRNLQKVAIVFLLFLCCNKDKIILLACVYGSK